MDSRQGLPPRTILDGSYRITRVVGSGGFGITYEAEDSSLGTKVAIKEYYPVEFGDRDATLSVRPRSERHKQTFDWGLANFLREARTLARFDHPSIVQVARVFEANSTAYMVMRLERGRSFEDWLEGLDRLPTQEELDHIAGDLLDALEVMHAKNFLHRDIAPDNILVRADGSPVLIDFGAARHAVAEVSRTLTSIVKAGYSPHEQYTSDNRLQGPWSDLFAFGGTLYRAVTGRAPEESTLRFDEDRMLPAATAAKGKYRAGFLSGIDACLKVRPADRPRSVAELRQKLFEEDAPSFQGLVQRLKAASRPILPAKSDSAAAPLRPSSSARWPLVAAALLAVMGGVYGGYHYMSWQPADPMLVEARRLQAEEAARRQAVLDAEKAEKQRKEAEEAARRQSALDAAWAEKLRKDAEEAARRQAAVDAEKKRKEAVDADQKRQAEVDAERAPLTKRMFRDCPTCPEMTVVPTGDFLMGSSREDIGAGAPANEGPQRKITIKRELAVGRFEVTRDQFQAFVQASGYKFGDTCWTLEGNTAQERDGRSFRSPGYAQTATHPAVCVSWRDAKAYVEWLSNLTSKPYRLLSEAEWEYIARAGTSTRYPSGSTERDLCAFGNGADQAASSAKIPTSSGYLECTDGYVYTAPVGSFKANGFGVFDLTGNVWEWVEDCESTSLENAPSDGVARSTGDCSKRTVRGGSWSAGAQTLRIPVRASPSADARYDDVGFRVARNLTLQP